MPLRRHGRSLPDGGMTKGVILRGGEWPLCFDGLHGGRQQRAVCALTMKSGLHAGETLARDARGHGGRARGETLAWDARGHSGRARARRLRGMQEAIAGERGRDDCVGCERPWRAGAGEMFAWDARGHGGRARGENALRKGERGRFVTLFLECYRWVTNRRKLLTGKGTGCNMSVQMKVGKVCSRFSYGNGMPR